MTLFPDDDRVAEEIERLPALNLVAEIRCRMACSYLHTMISC